MNSHSARRCLHARSGFASNRGEMPAGLVKTGRNKGKGETKELALAARRHLAESRSRNLRKAAKRRRQDARYLLFGVASREEPRGMPIRISRVVNDANTGNSRRSLKLSGTARPRAGAISASGVIARVNQLYPKITSSSLSLSLSLSLSVLLPRRSPADLHNQGLIKRTDHTSALILSRANRSKRAGPAKSGRDSRRDPQNRARGTRH
jgi:hypothetical protein